MSKLASIEEIVSRINRLEREVRKLRKELYERTNPLMRGRKSV